MLSDSPPDNEFVRQLEKFKAVQEQVKVSRDRPDVSLYPPGVIVHFVKTDEVRRCCGHSAMVGSRSREYTPYYADNDEFTEIIISPSMALDHFPDRVCLSIEGVARAWGIDIEPGSNLASGVEKRGGSPTSVPFLSQGSMNQI